jgi:hypothetical protein
VTSIAPSKGYSKSSVDPPMSVSDPDALEPQCHHRFDFFQRVLPGLAPLPAYPPKFWALDQGDYMGLGSMASIILFLWLVALASGGKYAVISYWDGPNYIYAGMTLYHIPPDNLWTKSFRYPPSYFACHLPGFPLAIRLFATLCFNQFLIGAHLTILVVSLLHIYLFRRVLWIYDAVVNPALSALFLSFIPIRMIVYHTVGAREPLFLVFVYLAFIFLKVNKTFPLFLSTAGACITRVEGLILSGTVGLCYCLRLDIVRAFVIGLDLLAPASVLLLHHFRFGDWKAYYHFNQGHNALLHFPPGFELRDGAVGNSDVQYHLSALSLFAIFAVGTLLVFPVSVPFGIFTLVYLIFSSSLWHIDLYRYALPGYIFAIFVGFDELWSSSTMASAMVGLSLLIALPTLCYGMGQLMTNVAPSWFTGVVLSSKLSYY